MNIVIVGGGTAGWVAAYYIISAQPNVHKITLIESSKIGIIGAGEGSTAQLLKLLINKPKGFFNNNLSIDDFMQETDSTNKMGIRYEKWSGPNSSYFAPILTSITDKTKDDYMFKYVLSEFGGQKVHLSSPSGIKYETKQYKKPLSFHFDAHKVGAYFKKICGTKVDSIDAVVNHINVNPNGHIESLVLDNQQTIDGDLFIDCSGFARILMKKMNVNWVSCSKYLPVNTAMPFLIKYKDNEEVIPETKATALSSGWLWNIPLTTRRGCGYVFDDNFISQEDAKLEVEKYLGQEIEPIKFIKFDSGYGEVFWKNNVLSLGLSSSFFEPLQATSIHNTIIQTLYFVDNFLSNSIHNTINDNNINKYNKFIDTLMISSLNLISLNYQGGREDSDFWKSIKFENKVTDDIKYVIELYQTQFPKKDTLDMNGHGFGLIDYNMAGLDLIPKDLAYNDLVKNNKYEYAKDQFNKFYNIFSYNKKI